MNHLLTPQRTRCTAPPERSVTGQARHPESDGPPGSAYLPRPLLAILRCEEGDVLTDSGRPPPLRRFAPHDFRSGRAFRVAATSLGTQPDVTRRAGAGSLITVSKTIVARGLAADPPSMQNTGFTLIPTTPTVPREIDRQIEGQTMTRHGCELIQPGPSADAPRCRQRRANRSSSRSDRKADRRQPSRLSSPPSPKPPSPVFDPL